MKSNKSFNLIILISLLLVSSCKKDSCNNGNAILTVNNNTNSAINITISGQFQNNVGVGEHGGFSLNPGSYNVRYVPSNAPNAAYNEFPITLASCEAKTVSAESQWGDCAVNNRFSCNIYNNRFATYTVYVDGIFQTSLSYQESINVDLSAGTHSISATTSTFGYGDRSGSTTGAACEYKSWTIQ
jgi:hypothetical protein